MFKHVALASILTLGLGALVPTSAIAGRGGSAAKIRSAVASQSVDAILAEVERAEALICTECVDIVTGLLEHSRYEVRQVAAWWFAKRPGLRAAMAEQMVVDLDGGGSVAVRNAADYLGTVKDFPAIPALGAKLSDGGLSSEAKVAVVRALGAMGHKSANSYLTTAMSGGDAAVRVAALDAWQNILYQQGAAPAVALLADASSDVRARAAAVIGGLREGSGRVALEAVLVSDTDPTARRNAAWALGRLGQVASRPVLEAAAADSSSIVRGAVRASLALLR